MGENVSKLSFMDGHSGKKITIEFHRGSDAYEFSEIFKQIMRFATFDDDVINRFIGDRESDE